jgi:hypothetical protein
MLSLAAKRAKPEACKYSEDRSLRKPFDWALARFQQAEEIEIFPPFLSRRS